VERLSDVEARILGSLVEKSLATPDQYPLSVKALTAACNQKTSRDPLMSLEEEVVGKSLFPLIQRGLLEQRFDVGSRVPKFLHHIEGLVGHDPKVIGTVCVLLLRGPQTPGEVKGRTERTCGFASTAEAEALLQDLCLRPEPFVDRLPRQPGHKEVRYRQLFSGEFPAVAGPVAAGAQASIAPKAAPAQPDRVGLLEKRVSSLEARLKALEERATSPTTP